MPLTLATAMADCLRQAAKALEDEAKLLQSGEVVRLRGGKDQSKIFAEDLLHRARNMEASIMAFERVMDRKTP
jgi:hypothetical protein